MTSGLATDWAFSNSSEPTWDNKTPRLYYIKITISMHKNKQPTYCKYKKSVK